MCMILLSSIIVPARIFVHEKPGRRAFGPQHRSDASDCRSRGRRNGFRISVRQRDIVLGLRAVDTRSTRSEPRDEIDGRSNER